MTLEEARQYQDFVKNITPRVAEVLGVKPRTLRVQMADTIALPVLALAHERTIFLNSEWFRRHPDDYGTIVHEVAHAVMNIQVALEEEKWLIEGLAEYARDLLGYPSTTGEAPNYDRKGLFRGYQPTAHFFLWLRSKYGEEEVKEIARRISEGKTLDIDRLEVRLEEYKREHDKV